MTRNLLNVTVLALMLMQGFVAYALDGGPTPSPVATETVAEVVQDLGPLAYNNFATGAWAAGALVLIQLLIRTGKTRRGDGWFQKLGKARPFVNWGLALVAGVLSALVGGEVWWRAIVITLMAGGGQPVHSFLNLLRDVKRG